MKSAFYQDQDSALALALFQHMAEEVSAPAFFVADPDDDFRLLQASATFRHFGNRHETLHGMTLDEYIPILSPDKLQRLWQKARDYRSAFFESEYQLISGQRIAVEISFSLMNYGERELMAGYVRDISDRKQYEAQLQQQRQSFTESQRIAHVGSWRLNLASNVLDWSDEVFRIFEIEPTRFGSSYEAFLEIVHPDDRDALNRAYAISLENRAPYEIEHRLLMADGRIKYVVERGETSYDEDGAPLFSLGTVQDITERKRMEVELQHREQYQRTLLDNFPYLVWLKDKDSRLLAANSQYARLAKVPTTRELEGKTDFDLFPQDLAEKYAFDDQAVMASVKPRNYEELYLDEKGERRWMEIWKSPVIVGDQVVGTVGCVRDITERKQYETSLLERAEMERRQSQFFRVAPGCFYTFIMRPDGSIAMPFASAGMADLYGLLPEDAMKDVNILLNLMQPDDVGIIFEAIEKSARDLTPYHVEFRIAHHEKGLRWLEAKSLPQRNPDGSIHWHGFMHDITERKRMESALVEREREFSSLAENLPDNIARWDTEGRILYSNPTHQRTLGKPASELIGKTHSEVFPDERFASVDISIAQVVASSQVVRIDRQPVPNENGGMDIHDIRLVPERDANGKVISVLGLGRDMTNMYRMQEVIAAREHEFRSLAESAPFSIIRYDHDCRIRYLNSSLAQDLGIVATAVVGKLPSEAWPDGRFSEVQQAVVQVIETKAEASIELRRPVADGEFGFGQIRIVPEMDVVGQVIGAIAFGWDITDLKRYAQSLLDRAKLEEQLSAVAASVPGCIYTIRADADGHTSYPYASAGIEELFGIRPEDVCEDAAVVRARYHPEDLNRALGLIEASKQDLSPYRVEIRIQHPEKGQRWIEIRSTPQRHEDGSTEWHGLMLDITERKQAEMALMELNAHLEKNARDLEEQATELEASQEQLKLTEAWYRGIVHSAPDGMVVVDARGRISLVNENLEKMFGYSGGELAGQPMEILLPSSMREGHVAKRIGFFASGATGRPMDATLGHLYACRKDGSVFPVDVSLSRLPDADRAGVICAAIRDVTERKRMEDVLAARELEFRTLVENLPIYVVRLDQELCRTYVNPAYAVSVGIPEAELLGAHASTFWRATNVSADAYIALLTRVLWSGVQEEVSLEWCDAEGRLVSHLVRVAPEFSTDGEAHGLLVLGFDISERNRQQALDAERQRIFETIAHGGELDETLDRVARYVESAKSGRHCCILLPDADRTRLVSVAAPSLPVPCRSSLDGIELCEENGCCATAVLRGERIAVENLGHHTCPERCQVFARENGVAACWSEPIVESSGKALGVVVIYLEQDEEADSQDLALLRHASYLSSIAIERKRLESQMLHQASYDSLTGLPNRRLFGHRLREEIAKAEREGQSLALFFIDLDRFKEVNDTLGHDAGDLLLTKTAQRIRACVRESDTVARLGGDEFVVVVTQVEDISCLGRLAQSIVDDMAQPFYLGEHMVYVSASIGIAGYPLDADSAENLIGSADQAMYAAKGQGRNNFSFFTADMQQQVQARMLLINDLRDGLGKNQLQVNYQPIVDIATGRILKAEALLRWKHPDRGMVPPDQFIPVAEENGLIHEIGDWVFREAVNVAKRWGAMDEAGGGQISVNVSPRQFAKGDIDAVWIAHLQSSGLPPAQIAIEITEGILLDDRMEMKDTLERLREAGLQISLDDFGTGYSAMAYLKKFNIDYLKIDRSFVRDLENDPGDRAIAEAIVVMAHKLGLKTIAEGVETEAQRDLLAAVGCEYVQGYLYAKPMPEAQFLEFVEQYNMKERC